MNSSPLTLGEDTGKKELTDVDVVKETNPNIPVEIQPTEPTPHQENIVPPAPDLVPVTEATPETQAEQIQEKIEQPPIEAPTEQNDENQKPEEKKGFFDQLIEIGKEAVNDMIN